LVAVLGWWLAERNRSDPVAETEIFEGVWYGCRVLSATAEGSGPVHWARIDLTAPGVGLYVTPTDPDLAGSGYNYRLKRVGPVARTEGLAVAVNGSLFTKEPYPIPGYWPGQRANGVETVVADGRVSHLWEHTYLLWFDADRVPTLERQKPPPPAALVRARWAVGGQGVGLADGRVSEGAGREPAARTAVGIDPRHRLLFLAVFESASPHRALEELASLGARDGLMLDGGGSSAMTLGAGATGVEPGTVLGGWRPVATQFGVRANPKRP
jgi:hypothetical protein